MTRKIDHMYSNCTVYIAGMCTALVNDNVWIILGIKTQMTVPCRLRKLVLKWNTALYVSQSVQFYDYVISWQLGTFDDYNALTKKTKVSWCTEINSSYTNRSASGLFCQDYDGTAVNANGSNNTCKGELLVFLFSLQYLFS